MSRPPVRHRLVRVAVAALCAGSALLPPASLSAGLGAGLDATGIGEATLGIPMDIGLQTLLIGAADQNAPAQSTSTTFQIDHTHDGLHETGTATHTLSYSVGMGHATADATIVVSTTQVDTRSGAQVARRTSTAHAHFDINACPDENGVAAGHVDLVSEQATTSGGGQQSGGTASVRGAIRFVDGEDAHLVSTEMDMALQADVHGYDGQKPYEAGFSQFLPMSMSSSGTAQVDGSRFTETHTGQDQYKPGDSASLLQLLFQGLVMQVAGETEKFWRSGKCIALKPSRPSGGVAPHESISLTVESWQRFDSKEVKAPIKADLTGVESLDPEGKPIDEPAKFDYVAGPNDRDEGTIALLQVGKRGIGKETVKYVVDCLDLEVSYSGSNHFSGGGKTVPSEIRLPPTRLKCTDDGTFEGQGQLTVKGTSAAQMSAGGVDNECHGTFEHHDAVLITAEIDEADPKQVRIGIQGAGDHTAIGVSEIAETDAGECITKALIMGQLIVRHLPKQTWFPDGIDMWQRMVGTAVVTLDKPLSVRKSIGQGGASDETSTTIAVTRAKR